MQNKLISLAVLSCVLFPATVLADTIANDLTQIEGETAVLKARAKKIEVQAQIATKQAEIDRLTGKAVPGDPTVRAIEGIGKTLYSTLLLENGSTVDVKSGDTLPNGLKVVSIKPNAVTVQRKNRQRFQLATGAPGWRNPGSVSSSLPLPGMPPPFALGAPR